MSKSLVSEIYYLRLAAAELAALAAVPALALVSPEGIVASNFVVVVLVVVFVVVVAVVFAARLAAGKGVGEAGFDIASAVVRTHEYSSE